MALCVHNNENSLTGQDEEKFLVCRFNISTLLLSKGYTNEARPKAEASGQITAGKAAVGVHRPYNAETCDQ